MKHIPEEDIRRAISLISKSTAHEAYFFSKADSPLWLEPLRKMGIFKSPQQSIRNNEGIRFPAWTPLRYLIRMAPLEPERVMEIILEAEETDNPTVHTEFIEAALQMPPNIARRIVPRIERWREGKYKHFYSEKVAHLIKGLAEGGFSTEALFLARKILQLRPKHEAKGIETGEEEHYVPPPEAIAFIEEYDYKLILSIALRPLLLQSAATTFELLAELLEEGILITVRDDKTKRADDFSYIWRENVADDKRTYSQPFLNLLISSLRDAGIHIGQNRTDIFRDAIRSILKKKWPIFWRIGLHLVGEFPDLSEHLLPECIASKTFFDSLPARHEYYALCLKHFQRLDEGDKGKVLNWIEAGPDTQSYISWVEDQSGTVPSAAIVQDYKKRWQRDRLSALLEGLSPQWRTYYSKIVQELGEPSQPDYPSRMSFGWVGPTSPKSVDDLLAMHMAEIVEFLRSWQPEKGEQEFSPEGLGRILEEAVTKNPLTFAESANLFVGLDPTYVRQIISGLASATQKNVKFPWERVFELVADILSRPRSIPNRQVELGDADPDWTWTRKSIASMIGYSLAARHEMPFAYREQLWTFLSKLAEDPEPDTEYEKRYGGSNMDPATLSINTVRGEAMHSVVKYALWCKRELVRQPSRSGQEVTFQDIPEVRDTLEDHLNKTIEPTLTIRAIYGQWFPWLVQLDPRWASKNSTLIFPTNPKEVKWFEAAWYTYINFCQPFPDVFAILQPQYSHAVNSLGRDFDNDYGLIRSPSRTLAEHLMVFYWTGRLSLSDDILTAFFRKAPEPLRAHAIEFVGRSLEGTAGEVPSSVLGRLTDLFLWRLSSTLESQANGELVEFGWWVASRKFSTEWWLPILLEVLKRCKGVEWDHEVVKVLNENKQTHLSAVLQCVDLMVRGERDMWSGMMWRESLLELLRYALDSRDAAIEKQSVGLINYLGAKGYNEYRSLGAPREDFVS